MLDSSLDLTADLRSRRALLDAGWTERGILRAVDGGILRPLRRGWYVEQERWDEMWPEQRHRIEVIAAAREARGPVVMSHTSAAVLWRLPLYRTVPKRVHVTFDAGQRASSTAPVARHLAPLPPSDLAMIDGIRCTSLPRTVFDLLRTMTPEAAVSVADAAERMRALRGREWDAAAAESWRGDLARRMAGAAGARGIRQATWIAGFADGHAQLPGESVSRLQLHRIGFAPPRLQVEIGAPDGGSYFVDFGLDDVHAFGEFDGETKYRDEAKRSGLNIEDVMIAEKQREDWIRGRTQRPFGRWGSAHIHTADALAARLAAFGIAAP